VRSHRVDATRGDHDVPIVSGESAAGRMGVLIAAAADTALRTALALDDG
jgi:hypothetical protein